MGTWRTKFQFGANNNLSETAEILDKAVAAAKSTYAVVDMVKLGTFLQGVFSGKVVISNVGGGSEKSGSSSGILMFDVIIGEGNAAQDKSLVLRYDPQSEERLFYEYDLESQYWILEKLSCTDLPLPRLYGLDATGDNLGVAGFIMERVAGEPIPTSLFASGPLVDSDEPGRDKIYRNVLNTLVSIHSLDIKALGVDRFTKVTEGHNFNEKLVNWWWKTWEWAKPDDFERLAPVRQWLLDNAPNEPAPVLMHGDPNLGNYLLRDGEVTAILDWELSSIGSPELDLALQVLSMEAHLPNAEHLPVQPQTQEQWLSRYRECGGRPLKNFGYFRKQAAYQILICLGSMCSYLPEEIKVPYQQMSNFYWAVINKE
jgi:aminoglycoside phosphotransferase (APT) family kinase protein